MEPKIQPQTQARFWLFHRSDLVLLKLNPGQSIEHHEGGETDEGFEWTSRLWSHMGDHILIEWSVRGSDCDGRYSRGGTSVMALSELRAGHEYNDNGTLRRFPVYRSDREWQRDHSAEAMNY